MAAKKKRSAKKGGGKQKKGKRGATRTPRTTEDVIDANRSGSSLPDEIVEEALIGGDHRDLLEDYFGEDVYEELRALATRSRRAQVRGGPRVLILPGIMGSKLGTRGRVFDDTIWIDPVDVIAGRLAKLELKAGDSAIEPLGVLLTTYLKLKLRLRLAGFDAAFHPYDWRQGIQDLGVELADRVRQETKKGDTVVPLYLVAHSMGGLVSRAALRVLDEGGRRGLRQSLGDARHAKLRFILTGTGAFGISLDGPQDGGARPEAR
jgi:hypothetical protein